MIVEVGFAALLLRAVHKALARSKISPEREVFYEEALANLRGPGAPAKFRLLAKRYAEWGHRIHAGILRRRADYLDKWENDPAGKAKMNAIVAKAMKSGNVESILQLADWLEFHTATGRARDLRAHAKEVQEQASQETAVPQSPQEASGATA